DIEAALKRAAPGFLKTVGVWNPSEEQITNPYYGTATDPISTWQMLRMQLSQDYTVTQVDLSSGRVPGDVDVLVVVGPESFTDAEVFAVDQFLMRGGSLIVASGSYHIDPYQMSDGLLMAPIEKGLADLLAHHGVTIGAGMVMDPQNEPFPMQIPRNVGGMTVYEIQQINYPYFVDVRNDAMSDDSSIVSSLPAITLQWVSPLEIDETKNAGREVVTLLSSTEASWIRDAAEVQPDLNTYPEYGFAVEGEQRSRPLAVSIRGSFESYFKDKESPFATGKTPEGEQLSAEQEQTLAQDTIEQSPDSTRLVVVGSSEFLDDAVLEISQSQSTDRYLNNLQFLQNAVDWAVEDEDLLTIRSRGAYARALNPLTTSEESFWEGLNYAVGLLGLVAIGFVWNSRRRNEEPMQLLEPVQSDAVKEGNR
ncbi:MAG: ABC transporter permease, partial [Planctomycetes bacterium]|nr:ABC transporter permease [Planctomycetota bacterium]